MSFHKLRWCNCRLTDFLLLVYLSKSSWVWCNFRTSVWPILPTRRWLVLCCKSATRPTHYSSEIYGYTDNQNKKYPLEDFLTNARARTSETETGTRLTYLTAEAFQFSLRVIPIIGERLLKCLSFLTQSMLQILSFISAQFSFIRPKFPITRAAVNMIQCTSFQQIVFSLQTKNTSVLPSPAVIYLTYPHLFM